MFSKKNVLLEIRSSEVSWLQCIKMGRGGGEEEVPNVSLSLARGGGRGRVKEITKAYR